MFNLPDIGFSQLIFFFGVAVAIVVFRRSPRIRSIGPALVVRSFHIVPNPPDDVWVVIVGRASGIVQWLMTIFELDTETTFKIRSDRIEKKSSSLSAQQHQVLPISKVSTTLCGYSKPLWLLILGITFVASIFLDLVFRSGNSSSSSISGSDFVFFIIGTGLIIGYQLSKKLSLIIEAGGGTPIGIQIKPSVLEQVSFDLKQALEVVEILNERVVEQSNPNPINQFHQLSGVASDPPKKMGHDQASSTNKTQSQPSGLFAASGNTNRAVVPSEPQLHQVRVLPNLQPENKAQLQVQCPYCLEPLTDDTLYCEECGRQAICRQCHQLLVKDSQTCTGCGEVLAVR